MTNPFDNWGADTAVEEMPYLMSTDQYADLVNFALESGVTLPMALDFLKEAGATILQERLPDNSIMGRPAGSTTFTQWSEAWAKIQKWKEEIPFTDANQAAENTSSVSETSGSLTQSSSEEKENILGPSTNQTLATYGKIAVANPTDQTALANYLRAVYDYANTVGVKNTQVFSVWHPLQYSEGNKPETISKLLVKVEEMARKEGKKLPASLSSQPSQEKPASGATTSTASAKTAQSPPPTTTQTPPAPAQSAEKTGTALIPSQPKNGLIINMETGEIENPEEIPGYLEMTQAEAQAFGIKAPEQFNIVDETTADWFVSRIRARQSRVERIVEMAVSVIKGELSAMCGMMWKYGGQLRQHSEARLEKKKNGQYRAKNVKFTEGAVHFKKVGGIKCLDGELIQTWIDGIVDYDQKYKATLEWLAIQHGLAPDLKAEITKVLAWESQLDGLPIQRVRKFDVRDFVKVQKGLIEDAITKSAALPEDAAPIAPIMLPGMVDNPVNETFFMSIGGARAWSLNKQADSLKSVGFDKYKGILGAGESDTDIVDAEVIEE